MKIALVGHDFDFSAKDGISRYSYELFKHLQKDNEVFRYDEKGSRSERFVSNILPGLRRYFGVRIEETVDIVHLVYPNAAYPITDAPVVVTWHDANIFSRYKTANLLSKKFYHYLGIVLPALRNTAKAKGIIYVSYESKKQLASRISRDKPSVVIPEGIDDEFVKAGARAVAERHDFVYVGSVEYAHKNVDFLLKSFEAANTGEKLYIFTPTEKSKIPNSYFNAKNVRIVIGASTKAIASKLKSSIALLHFSLSEGFGLTILEAMAVGTPAVVLAEADIPQMVTRYAIKVHASDATSEIQRLAREKPELKKEAIAYAKGFSWRTSVDKTVAFYKKLLNQ